MKLQDVVKKDDLKFYNKCQNKSLSKRYFERIRYDKTLFERTKVNKRRANKYCRELITDLKPYIQYLDGIVAARVTGSAPVGLCGSAIRDVKEELVEDELTFSEIPITKAPDVDFEFIVDSPKFVRSQEYALFVKHVESVNKKGLRLSFGFIVIDSISRYSIRNIFRWGFLKNEVILKGKDWYKKETASIWEYIKIQGKQRYYVALVGRRHLLYAIKNAIKYGKADSYTLKRSEYPKVFEFYLEWERTVNDLFFKEDFE